MLAHPNNKTAAIVCNDGRKEILVCPENLEFYVDNKSCDIPRNEQEALGKLAAEWSLQNDKLYFFNLSTIYLIF